MRYQMLVPITLQILIKGFCPTAGNSKNLSAPILMSCVGSLKIKCVSIIMNI